MRLGIKIMITIQQKILQQIILLRDCFEDYKTEAIAYTKDLNTHEDKESQAEMHVVNNVACDEAGELLPLTNDFTRKSYVKDKALVYLQTANTSKTKRDAADKKIDVEISVLSAMKQLLNDEAFDQNSLGKFEI